MVHERGNHVGHQHGRPARRSRGPSHPRRGTAHLPDGDVLGRGRGGSSRGPRSNRRGHDFYTRYGNPNHAQVSAVVAELEHTEAAMVTASGMAALTTAVLALVSAGDHVIGQKSTYGGTASVLLNLLPRLGVSTSLVDQTDPEAFEKALTPQTRLILVESPSNPLLQITDLRAVAKLARAHDVLTMADNTFATPVNQRPADFGIDLVWHSATKYLNGHTDVSAGVLAGPARILDRIWDVALLTGAVLGPFDAWLLLRGLRTLPLRVARHNVNGQALAEALEDHPAVARVHYPGLATHPQHTLAGSQMSGFGGVLGIELAGGFEAADAFLGRLRYARRSASLGGVESLAVHPASMWRGMLSERADRRLRGPAGPGPVGRGHGGHGRPGRRRARRGRRADVRQSGQSGRRAHPMRTLLSGGTVVSMDPAVGDLDRGDVLIAGRRDRRGGRADRRAGRRGDRRDRPDRAARFRRHPPAHLADGVPRRRRGLDLRRVPGGDPRQAASPLPARGRLPRQPARPARGPELRRDHDARLVPLRAEPRARRRRRRGAAGRPGPVDLLLRRRMGHHRPGRRRDPPRPFRTLPGTAWSPWRWDCADRN